MTYVFLIEFYQHIIAALKKNNIVLRGSLLHSPLINTCGNLLALMFRGGRDREKFQAILSTFQNPRGELGSPIFCHLVAIVVRWTLISIYFPTATILQENNKKKMSRITKFCSQQGIHFPFFKFYL